MIRHVEAVYEHGVFRPLEPLAMTEAQRVRLIIAEESGAGRDSHLTEHVRKEAAALTISPTIEEVREALSSIPGSLSEDVIAERGEY